MFGHNDDNQQNQNQQEATTVQPTAVSPATDMQGFTPPPTPAPAADPAQDATATAAAVTDEPEATSTDPVPTTSLDVSADSAIELPQAPSEETPDSMATLPGNLMPSEPSTDTSAAPEPATTAPTPATSLPADDSAPDEESTPSATVPSELINIKQDALQNLSPLVEHLEQTPEEKFRTTMMMIQATDDSTKIKAAYDAAQQIEDDKVRAQALLDVINEINYFTQQAQQKEEA